MAPCSVVREILQRRSKMGMLSAMQIEKGVKKGEPTFLAALVEEEETEEGYKVPGAIAKDGGHENSGRRKSPMVNLGALQLVQGRLQSMRGRSLDTRSVWRTKPEEGTTCGAAGDAPTSSKSNNTQHVGTSTRNMSFLAMSQVSNLLLARTKVGLQNDVEGKKTLEAASKGQIRRFWMEVGY